MSMRPRLILSPYWLSQEDAQTIAAFEKNQQSDRRRLEAKDRLGVALDQGVKLINECRSKGVIANALNDKANVWWNDLQNLVRSTYGEGEVSSLQHGWGTVVYSDSGQPNEDLRVNLDRILQRLTKMIQSADTKPLKDDVKI